MTARETWIRGLYILLFAILYNIAEVLLVVLVVLQFVSTLLTGATDPRLRGFGQSLSTYVYQVFRYLTFNSDVRPFPFSAWPRAEDDAEHTPKPE